MSEYVQLCDQYQQNDVKRNVVKVFEYILVHPYMAWHQLTVNIVLKKLQVSFSS